MGYAIICSIGKQQKEVMTQVDCSMRVATMYSVRVTVGHHSSVHPVVLVAIGGRSLEWLMYNLVSG